jgi:hypothetical protein
MTVYDWGLVIRTLLIILDWGGLVISGWFTWAWRRARSLDVGISICWVVYRHRVLLWCKLDMRKKPQRSALELFPAIAQADLYNSLKYARQCVIAGHGKNRMNENEQETKARLTYRSTSSRSRSSHWAANPSILVDSSFTLVPRTSSWSSTLSRRLDWFRDVRHVSPSIRAAATVKRKPSARVFAPFSMALKKGL